MNGAGDRPPAQTRQRLAVFESLARAAEFTSAEDLYHALRKQGYRIGLNTVYRNLRRLAETGRLDVFHDEGGKQLFRIRPASGHSHYLVCRNCGRSHLVAAEEIEEWVGRTAARHGFSQVRHIVELTGLCSRCTRPAM